MQKLDFNAWASSSAGADAGVWDRDETPTCDRCRGAGFWSHDVPIYHPDFARLIPCGCMSNVSAEVRTARSNLTGLEHCTFASFNAAVPGALAAYEACAAYATIPQGWLVLSGEYGCGKSHLAMAIAHDTEARGYKTLFATAPDLLDTLRAAIDDTNNGTLHQQLEHLKTVHLLVLDDYGTQSDKPWVREKLFQILDARYRYRRATVVTTNLTPAELKKADPRIASRLGDVVFCEHIPMAAGDYRRLSARERARTLP